MSINRYEGLTAWLEAIVIEVLQVIDSTIFFCTFGLVNTELSVSFCSRGFSSLTEE